MIWLDLAAQNGENLEEKLYQEKPKVEPSKKRVITAHGCTNLKKRNSLPNNFNRYKMVEEIADKKEIILDEETGKTNNVLFGDQSILKGLRLEAPNSTFDEVSYCEVTSHVETQEEVDHVTKDKKTQSDNYKRQLHIFMPNIPNKSDCDSSISSRMSTLLSKSIK